MLDALLDLLSLVLAVMADIHFEGQSQILGIVRADLTDTRFLMRLQESYQERKRVSLVLSEGRRP